jgi:DNA-binding GntR family transcriptional regulator
VYRRYIRRYDPSIASTTPPEPARIPLGEQAYQRLRELIVRIELAPGALLSEDELQTLTGIGRTPIREALQRLERDKLVRILPRRGLLVAPIDLADLALLYESRAMLEPHVHRLAAARGDERQWAVIEAALDHVDALGLSATWADLLDADRVCHEQVWAASANRFLTETLDMLYTQSQRLWHQYVRDVSDLRSALAEHRLVLAALRAGDGETAATLMENHVRSFENQIREVLKRWLDPSAAQTTDRDIIR